MKKKNKFSNANDGNVIISKFKESGYYCVPQLLPSQKHFDEFYDHFDQLITAIATNPDIATRLNEASDNWKRQPEVAYYNCNAPAKYVDRMSRDDKENKIYYQCSWDFINYFGTHYHQMYEDIPELYEIHDFFRSIHLTASVFFKDMVGKIDNEFPGIADRLIDQDKALPITLKVLKYTPAPSNFTTSPHYDKGAFTMIVNNDDKENDKLVIGSYPDDGIVKISRMKIPEMENVAYNMNTTAIIIPDSTLIDVGFEIYPSPHAVLPNPTNRFATIAFLLVHSLGEVTKPVVKFENDVF
jgi:hypothetical protein